MILDLAGLCECGCGQKTNLAPQNDASKGWRKNEPLRFVKGHPTRLPAARKKISKARTQTSEHGTRVCYMCGVEKPLGEFRVAWSKARDTYRYHECHDCARDRRRESRLRIQFNITVEEYDHMLAEQGGVCAICRNPPTTKRLAIDHDHGTGLIRGLVCWWCNRLVGVAKDNAERLRAASDYLMTPPAVAALGEERYGRTGRVTKKRKKTTSKRRK